MAGRHLRLPLVVGFYIRGEMWLGLKMLPGWMCQSSWKAQPAYDTLAAAYARDWDGRLVSSVCLRP